MKQAVIDLFSSKKGIVFAATAIIVLTRPLLAKIGYEIDSEQLIEFLSIAGAYVVGQGIADHGKEAAKISVAAYPATTTPPQLESGSTGAP